MFCPRLCDEQACVLSSVADCSCLLVCIAVEQQRERAHAKAAQRCQAQQCSYAQETRRRKEEDAEEQKRREDALCNRQERAQCLRRERLQKQQARLTLLRNHADEVSGCANGYEAEAAVDSTEVWTN